jgi:hypothetical protein
MNKVIGIGMVALALAVAVVPVFTDCESAGRHITTQDGKAISMKCHWTGIAELGAAAPLALVGILALKRRRQGTTRVLAGVGAVSGAMAILFPTVLMGVCMNALMPCAMIMRPALVAAGILAIASSAVLAFVAGRAPAVEAAPAGAETGAGL